MGVVIMVNKLYKSVKSKLAAIIAVIMAVCFGLTAFGCGKDESDYEYAMRIAKEEFGCERILWYAGGDYSSELVSVYLYDTYGHKSTVPYSVFDQQNGGDYVVGVDKYGYEMFIAIPDQESTDRNPKEYSPRLIQWPFAYSFTEIAKFAAEHGYKYADGIDGLNDELLIDYYKASFTILCREDRVMYHFKEIFSDAEKKYDELDVKFVLSYRDMVDEMNWSDYYIMQIDGKLIMYENKITELESTINEITYERNYIEDAVRIAHADFGCEKILWVDFAEHQNNVIENCIPPEGGYYVVGVDKDGNEVYVAVPRYKSVKYKESAFEWKFDYTFYQIARVFGKHGYKYADGIDGMENEYIRHYGSTAIVLTDEDDYVKSILARYGNADELYENLDVKLVFSFYKRAGDGVRIFRLTQQGGLLVMYETLDEGNGNVKNMGTTVYNKDNI